MKRERLVCILLCVLVSSSCATVSAKHEELPQPAQRIALKKFSFMPPSESGWSVRERSGEHIAIGRLGANQDESFVILASPVRLIEYSTEQQFLDYIKQNLERDTHDDRYRNVRNQVRAIVQGGVQCALYTAEAEDHGAVTRSGRKDPMIFQVQSIVCVHPNLKNIGVYLSRSHRHYPEHLDASQKEAPEQLFQSIEYSVQ